LVFYNHFDVLLILLFAAWTIQLMITLAGVVASSVYMIRVSILPPAGDATASPDELFGFARELDRVQVSVRDEFEVNSIVTPCSVAALGECTQLLL
jgi:hypothetical protein